MKKGNKVLALFLAAVMLVTSIAWDFGDVSEAEAAGTESTATVGGHSGLIEFDDVDVTTLNEHFTSTQLNGSTYAIVEQDATVESHWSSDKTLTSSSTLTVTGIKPLTHRDNDNKHNLLKYNNAYKNFKLSVRLTFGTNVGIAIGNAYTYPLKTTEDAILVAVDTTSGQNNTRLRIRGGIDRNTAKATGTLASNTISDSQCLFRVTETSNSLAATTQTVNIRMEDGVLTVWVDGFDEVFTADVASTYPEESNISLWAMGYNNNISFRTFEVWDLDKEGYTNFDGVDVSTLNNNFTSTKLDEDNSYAVIDGEQDQTVESHWYSRAALAVDSKFVEGIKPLTHRDDRQYNLLKYNTPYKNFELSVKLTWGTNIGIVLGDTYTYPLASTEDAILIIPDTGDYSRLKIRGGIDLASATATGTIGSVTTSSNQNLFKVSSSSLYSSVQTINVKMLNGVLTISVDGYDEVYTVNVASTYPDDTNISLWAIGYSNNISFREFEVHNLDDAYVNFDYVDVTALNDYFTSTQMTEDSTNGDPVIKGQQDVAVENHWSTTTSTVVGIKPKTLRSDKKHNLLKYNEVYKNFEATIKFTWNTNVGFVIGSAYRYPYASTTDAILIVTNDGNLRVRGAIDTSTASVEGTIKSNTISTNQCLVKMASSTLSPSEQTIHIRLLDGVLTIWLDSSDEVLTVNVASTYPNASNISLWALGYDNKNSFMSFQINNLDDAYANFDDVDVTTLNENFTSTQLDEDGNYAIIDGQKDVGVENHWSSDKTLTGSSTTVTGIKPLITRESRKYHMLKYNDTYDDFQLSVRLTWGTNIGIAIGNAYTFPLAATEDAILISPDTGDYSRLRIRGAINASTASAEGTLAKVTTSGGANYFKVAENSLGASTQTINIKKENSVLTIWVDNYDEVYTVNLASSYPDETNISLWAIGYNNAISFRNFAIREIECNNNTGTTVDIDGYTDFDNVDMSVLEEKGFTATLFDTENDNAVVGADKPVSTYWAVGADVISANDGMKPKAAESDKTMTLLNTPYEYTDFRISTEVYWGASTGIVLGAKNVFPSSTTDSAVRIFFNSNQIQLTGAGIDPETAKVTGGATWNPNYLTTYIFKPDSSFTVTKGEVYKLNAEMKAGVLTVWVDGYDSSVTVKTTSTFKQESIALMARQYNGDGGGLKSLMVEEIENLAIPYTADEFTTYRSTNGYTAPTYKNYLFAGWFTDSACTLETAVSASTTTVENETVYAKFVPKQILTVKAQVSAELLDTDLTNDTTGTIRFATTVDTLNYSQVGFKVSYDKDGDGTSSTVTSASNQVYSQLNAIGGITYNPTDFCNSSIYFKACTVRNIGESYYDVEFEVTPFWKTLDGTVVNGDTVVKTINQGIDVGYLNKKTALFLGDSIMKGATDTPANDFHYLSWAGRLDRYYGMNVDKVAQSGWALTSDCPESSTSTTIRGQIVTQLGKASKESYDYVMLEGGCNDVLTYTNFDQTVMNEKWGEIQTADDAVLDDKTIAGAMQDLIVKAHTAYPNAKLVYIINSEYGLFDADQENIYNNEAKLAQMIKDVCMLYKEKGYDINYIDLSNTTVYPELSPLSLENASLYPDYTPDKLHPNAASYELSTPVIANFLREVGTGKLPEEVYVSTTGTTTLNDAIAQVVDGGTIYIQDEYAVESNFAWEEHGKKVAIAGAADTATLNFANVLNGTSTTINVKDDVTFRDLTLGFTTSGNQNIMANGYDFIVKDDVTFTGNAIKIHGGGSSNLVVDRTRLELYAGNYTEIYGGGSSGTVNYDTNIIIGSKVNSSVDYTSHDSTSYLVFGGVRNGTVKGDTNITVMEGANFHYIYGGTRDGGAVNGSTNIKFAGNTYGIYGGSCKGTVEDTYVEILGGNVYQVFGGCEKTSMIGNTDVQLLGGNVLRRVYGGCYNEYSSGWQSAYQVTGHANVTIGPDVNITFSSSDSDRGVFAGSRYSGAFDGEVGLVLFVDESYDAKNGVLGSQDFSGDLVVGTPEYNYLVKATAGGTVTSADGILTVTPNSGYTATVEGATVTAEGATTYTLPTETDTITVTFSATN